jgi:hypothetical protein
MYKNYSIKVDVIDIYIISISLELNVWSNKYFTSSD